MMTLAHEINVSLSLTVVSQDEDRLSFSVIPLLSLTTIMMLLWNIGLLFNRSIFTVSMLQADVSQFVDIAGKVLSILLVSLAWGVFSNEIRTSIK